MSANYENVGKRVVYAGQYATIMAVIGENKYLIKTDAQAMFKVPAQQVEFIKE